MCVYLITTTTQNVVNKKKPKNNTFHQGFRYEKHMNKNGWVVPSPHLVEYIESFHTAPVALPSLLGRHKEPP